MPDQSHPHALFEGLVVDEQGQPARVARVGQDAQYVIDDQGFERYIEAQQIDRQVLAWIKAQVQANQDEVTRGMMSLLGRDDLFTKAMLDSSIKNIGQLPPQPLPEDARAWLGMLGFRVVIDLHGEIVRLDVPGTAGEDGDE